MENNSSEKPSKPIIYACSGCSDAGELADRIARRLTQEGVGQMSCLAGVAGRVKHLVEVAEQSESILVIDGCPINCARKTLELAGVQNFEHLGLHELGLRKGHCPVSNYNIALGVQAATKKIALFCVANSSGNLATKNPQADNRRAVAREVAYFGS